MELLRALHRRGHRAHLVGGCVRDGLRGLPVTDFDIVTSATLGEVLNLFPRAIPISLRHSTAMVPTAVAPVDISTYRAGPSLHDDLAHRDFTLNAIAWDPFAGELVDPQNGQLDLAAGRLSAVGSAAERFAEDPLRMLRAARFVAVLQLHYDDDLPQAMASMRGALRSVAAERVRSEIEGILLAPHAAAGLALLRDAGIESDLAPGVDPRAGAIVEALPVNLDLRWVAWLRGSDPQAVLGPLHYGSRRIAAVARRVARYPLTPPHRGAELWMRRLLSRNDEALVRDLLAVRDAELANDLAIPPPERAAAQGALDEARSLFAQIRADRRTPYDRNALALNGRDVMKSTGMHPGPRVGEALDYLLEQVLVEPSRNTRDELERLLRGWMAQQRDVAAVTATRTARGERD